MIWEEETAAAVSPVGTEGAVVSLDTVTVTGLDVHSVPRSPSLATAVRVCEPLLAVVVFQGTE